MLFLCAMACIALLSSCSLEPYEEPAEESYTKEFIKTFGLIDKNQDWNMAEQFTAFVDLSNMPQSTYRVRVCTTHPINPDCRLMADCTINSGSASTITFDAPKGTASVYVIVTDAEGNSKVSNYYDVENGKVNVKGSGTRATTRAGDVCNTTVKTTPGNLTETYNKYNDDWSQITRSATFYDLDNVSKKGVDVCTWADLKAIVGSNGTTEGIFRESGVTDGKTNRDYYISNGILQKDVYYETNNQPVSVTYAYGNTLYKNKLCYYYYKANKDGSRPSAEEIAKAPRYILMDDATPAANTNEPNKLYYNSYAPDNTICQGTQYDLVFFGEDGTATPTFTFPEGYIVEFDIISGHNMDGFPKEENYIGRSNYSTTEQNEYFGIYYSGELKDQKGDIAAVTYKANGITVLGFEDRGNDKDMNDILLFVEGIKDHDIRQCP